VLAGIALRRGFNQQAIDLFREALAEGSLLAEADTLEDCLANAYLRLQRFDDAIVEYNRVLRLNPRYPLAHYRLGLAYDAARRPDLARQSYERFLSLWSTADPDAPEVIDAHARVSAASPSSPPARRQELRHPSIDQWARPRAEPSRSLGAR